MLTMFSTARAFSGIFDVIQRNAITSWTRLSPRPEIILFGEDPGSREICEELGLIHAPELELSDHGTPLVSDLFRRGQELASHDVCCFINSDIVVMSDFIRAVRLTSNQFSRFLMVGQRWDLDITSPLTFGDEWEQELGAMARRRGQLRSEVFVDYFVFPRGGYPEIPRFAIGRSAYDNWLIWRANDLDVPVVDATKAVTIVHQNHDYSHAGGVRAVFEGTEAQRAHALIGHWSRYHAIAHAQYMVTEEGEIVPARGLRYRLARPRRVASHLLRFTRPARRRFNYAKLLARQRGREGAELPCPSPIAYGAVGIASRIARSAPLTPIPGYTYGDVAVAGGQRLRLLLWLFGRLVRIERPMDIAWYHGLQLDSWLGDDMNKCLFVAGTYEPNELAFVEAVLREGDVVVDVGANEGLYTMLAARVVGPGGRVLAIEPSPREMGRLRRHLARNTLDNVVAVQVAIGAAEGEATLHVADGRRSGLNTFGTYAYGVRTGEDVSVSVCTLDSVVEGHGLARVDLIKADVEGAESKVLHGAEAVLRRDRPVLLLELQEASLQAQGSSTAAVVDFLGSLDYVLAPFSPETGRPTLGLTFAGEAVNSVAVPVERASEFRDAGHIDAVPTASEVAERSTA